MKKTNEEIQALKDNWKKDPNWDIEDIVGFEDHEEELRKFREDQELDWQIQAEERRQRRANVLQVEAGITHPSIQQQIETFGEIENDVIRSERSTDATIGLAAAQVRATLLLAAQVARIAEALEQRNEDDEADTHLDHMTRLYKGE